MLLVVETFNCPSFEQNDQTWYYCRHGSWRDWNHQQETHKKVHQRSKSWGKSLGEVAIPAVSLGFVLICGVFFLKWGGRRRNRARKRKDKERKGGKRRQMRDQEGTEEKRRKLTVNHQLPDANICQQSLNCDEFWTSPRSYQDRALFQLCF